MDSKLSELGELEAKLIQRELDLATFQAELNSFEREYIRIIGSRYAELDKIEAQIAEYFANLNPNNSEAQKNAEKARAKAQESDWAAGETTASRETSKEFKPSDCLKKLYREVAKCIHPDLTTDEKERSKRQQLMAEANQAYQDGDEERLRTILSEWECSPESIKGEGIGANLIRTIRKIAQVQDRLRNIEKQIQILKISDLFQLRLKVITAKEQGRDLMGEMAVQLDEQISRARSHLAKIIQCEEENERRTKSE